MALQTSGSISLYDIRDEFGQSNPVSLQDYYKDGGIVPNISDNSDVPFSGDISLTDFYGARNWYPEVISYFNSVESDGGSVRDKNKTGKFIEFLVDESLYSNLEFAYGGYGGGKGNIEKLYDFSGNGNHATQTTSTDRPSLGNVDYISFSNDYFDLPYTTSDDFSHYTLSFTIRNASTSQNRRGILGQLNSINLGYYFEDLNRSPQRLRHADVGGSTNGQNLPNSITSFTNSLITVTHGDTDGWNWYQNDNNYWSFSSVTDPQHTFYRGVIPQALGRRSTSYKFSGEIRTFLFFNTELTSSQVESINNYRVFNGL